MELCYSYYSMDTKKDYGCSMSVQQLHDLIGDRLSQRELDHKQLMWIH